DVIHSRATNRRSASKCQGKWPDQTLAQAFGLPDVLGAVSTSRLSCKRAGKTRTLVSVWDSSGESRINRDCFGNRWLPLGSSSGNLMQIIWRPIPNSQIESQERFLMPIRWMSAADHERTPNLEQTARPKQTVGQRAARASFARKVTLASVLVIAAPP